MLNSRELHYERRECPININISRRAVEEMPGPAISGELADEPTQAMRPKRRSTLWTGEPNGQR